MAGQLHHFLAWLKIQKEPLGVALSWLTASCLGWKIAHVERDYHGIDSQRQLVQVARLADRQHLEASKCRFLIARVPFYVQLLPRARADCA